MLKQTVLIQAIEKINSKIIELERIAEEVKLSLHSDTKSSAGDKHETARAMVQLEQEKLSRQLGEFLQMKLKLNQINPTVKHNQVGMGSLIHTTLGWYFLSVGLGQFNVEETTVFALNPQAPLGNHLTGKRVGEEIVFNGNRITILELV